MAQITNEVNENIFTVYIHSSCVFLGSGCVNHNKSIAIIEKTKISPSVKYPITVK